MSECYQALEKQAALTGWPKQFAADLTRIDRDAIARTGAQPFLWCLREYGTWRHELFGLRDARDPIEAAVARAIE